MATTCIPLAWRWPTALACGLLLATAALVLYLRPVSPGGATPVRRSRGMSVLLVTIDTLRADALGSYGQTRVETPWLDRLAEAGVRFDFAPGLDHRLDVGERSDLHSRHLDPCVRTHCVPRNGRLHKVRILLSMGAGWRGQLRLGGSGGWLDSLRKHINYTPVLSESA